MIRNMSPLVYQLPRRSRVTRIVIKACGCGRTYTRDEWKAMTYHAEQTIPADQYGNAETLEYRHCVCRSTLALDIDPVTKEPL